MRELTSASPSRLPSPPNLLPAIEPIVWNSDLWRIANDSILSVRFYPKPRYRFDAPAGEYPALYTCASAIGTFAEVYGDRGRRLGPSDGQRSLLHIVPETPLRLIDLHDVRTLALLNLDERISVGDDYVTCQSWALSIYQQLPDISGIRYRARKAGATIANVVLFADRCLNHLTVADASKLEEIEELVLRAADLYRLTVYFDFTRPHSPHR